MEDKNSFRSRQKKKTFEDWMEGDHVLLHLDSRVEGVVVPEHLADNHSLTLKLSYYFQGETTHDDNGIVSFLRFDGVYHQCEVPWEAIWGMTAANQENSIWAEDLPREVILQLTKEKLQEFGRKVFNFGKKPSGEIDEDQSTEEEETPSTSSDEDQPESKNTNSKKRVRHLRRIK